MPTQSRDVCGRLGVSEPQPMRAFSADDVLVSELLLNDKLDAAAANLREKIKGGHNHFEEGTIATLVADRDSKSVSELDLEHSPSEFFAAVAERLFGQADASTVTLLRRMVALAAEKRAGADPELKVRMRARAKAMQYGTSRREYIAAVRDGREPGDKIVLELLADLLHLHVRLLQEDGSEEKEIKCAGSPIAELHLLQAGNTFCTLVVPDLKGVKQAAPADGVPKPPPDWVWPVVGELMEVDVEDVGSSPAKVLAVLAADGQFKMRVYSPDGDVWDDWFTPAQEGTDWKRPPLPLATDAAPASAIASPVAVPASPESDDTVDPHAGSRWEDHSTRAGRATPDGGGGGVGLIAAGAAINSGGDPTVHEARADVQAAQAAVQADPAPPAPPPPAPSPYAVAIGVTDLSQLRGAVDDVTKQMLAPVLTPADVLVESEATELSLEWPEQPTKMVALRAQCSAVEAEGAEVDAATEACLAMCDDKESALHAQTDKLESEVVQAEEALVKLKDLEASLQQAGCESSEVRTKLSAANSALEQLQRELAACGEALAVVQPLPEQLKQQVPSPPYPRLNPRSTSCSRSCPRPHSHPPPLASPPLPPHSLYPPYWQASDARQVRSAVMADLTKGLQACAEALPAELKHFVTLVAAPVVELRALVSTSEAKIATLRNIHQRSVLALEAEHDQASKEAAVSLELICAVVDKVADQLKACAAAVASLDPRARTTLHKGLESAAVGTHAAAEAKAELAPLLAAAEELQAAAEELQAAVKPTGSWLGAVGGFFGSLVGVKRARE